MIRWRRWCGSAWLATLGALLGCNGSFLDDLDLDQFTAAPAFSAFDLSRVVPTEPLDYVELRQASYATHTNVLASYGNKCGEASDLTTCSTEFDGLDSTDGFGRCVDHDCRKFYVINRGDTNFVADRRDRLLSFFGAIDAPEEALTMASEAGYRWNASNKEDGAYLAGSDGYQLIVIKTTNSCNPVETWRYLLQVTPAGEVSELEAEERSSDDACI